VWLDRDDWLLGVQGGQFLVLDFLSWGDNFHAPLYWFVFERERESAHVLLTVHIANGYTDGNYMY